MEVAQKTAHKFTLLKQYQTVFILVDTSGGVIKSTLTKFTASAGTYICTAYIILF